jgi:hypothetical protein
VTHKSLFSSWSQSLEVALSFGYRRMEHGKDDTYLSIVDTAKIRLSDPNKPVIFLYTPELGKVLDHDPYPHEFLCYGTVSGPHHKAVRFSELGGHPSQIISHSMNPKTAVGAAIEKGKLYGEQFELAMACYMLGGQPQSRKVLLDAVKRADVPPEWATDVSIIQEGYAHDGDGYYPNAVNAMELLRSIVKKFSTGITATKSQPTKTVPRARQESAKERGDFILDMDRISRETKELFIDMVGWESPVLAQTFKGRLRPRKPSKCASDERLRAK